MNSQKSLFSLEPGMHYLNCAYMSPMLKSVEEVGIKGIYSKRNPFHVTPADFFETSDKVRIEFAKLIDAESQERIALVSSTSYGLANVANNISLAKGDEIIILEGQFPSNYYVWEKVCDANGANLVILTAPKDFPKGKAWNEKILNAINSKTKVVAMPHVHWADGTLFDLKSIRKKTREFGALLIIDGTQSVGALPFSVKEFQPDALVCSGYKWLMGPYSTGVAYMGPYFDSGIPIEENWISRKNSENFKDLVNYQMEYQPGALRFDVGERSNFILTPMLYEALKQINEWGVENIYAYCDQLVAPTLEKLQDAGYQIEEPSYRSPHLFGLRKRDFDPTEFSKKLSEKHVFVSVRGDAVRVSVNVFNDLEDIKALEDVCLDLSI